MSFVWFTSYLAIFLVGFISSLFLWNAIINKMVNIQEKRMLAKMPPPKIEDRYIPDFPHETYTIKK